MVCVGKHISMDLDTFNLLKELARHLEITESGLIRLLIQEKAKEVFGGEINGDGENTADSGAIH